MKLGWDTATWVLAAGSDPRDEASVKKQAVALWDACCAPFEWVRFMHPGYGQWKEKWHNPKVDKWVCEALIEHGVNVLWTLTNRDSFSTFSGGPFGDNLGVGLRADPQVQVRNDITRLPEQVMFEETNGDTVADGISLNDVRKLVKVPKKRVLVPCGAFFYDWRSGDCQMKSWGFTKIVSECGVSFKTVFDNLSDGNHIPNFRDGFVPERIAHLIGLMKARGVELAFWHEPLTRGFQYDLKAMRLAPVGEEHLPHYELALWNQTIVTTLPGMLALTADMKRLAEW